MYVRNALPYDVYLKIDCIPGTKIYCRGLLYRDGTGLTELGPTHAWRVLFYFPSGKVTAPYIFVPIRIKEPVSKILFMCYKLP